MDNLIGYPLQEALNIIRERKENNIVNIKKLAGTNNKFNNLKNPYVIRCSKEDNYINLCVSYY